MWSFHVDDSQERHRYAMILGGEIFSRLKIDLCFYGNTNKGNGGTCEGCTALTKDI